MTLKNRRLHFDVCIWTISCRRLHFESLVQTVTCGRLHLVGFTSTSLCRRLHLDGAIATGSCWPFHVDGFDSFNSTVMSRPFYFVVSFDSFLSTVTSRRFQVDRFFSAFFFGGSFYGRFPFNGYIWTVLSRFYLVSFRRLCLDGSVSTVSFWRFHFGCHFFTV